MAKTKQPKDYFALRLGKPDWQAIQVLTQRVDANRANCVRYAIRRAAVEILRREENNGNSRRQG